MRHELLAALLLTGCQTTWPQHATIISPSGQRLCAKHRVPLVTVRAFRAPTHGNEVYLVHDAGRPNYGIAGQYFPNHYPEGVSPRPGWILTEPTTIQYCTLCESGFLNALRVPDEAGAIELADDYVFQLRGWTTQPDSSPHRVTLKDGIWTVVCSLPHGQLAVVRISKEEGSIVSAKRLVR